MEFSRDQVFTVSSDVLFQEVSGEAVLLDMASENYFGLDASGTRVWNLLNEGATLGAVLDALEQEYDVEHDVLLNDVGQLLEQLVEAGLIKA